MFKTLKMKRIMMAIGCSHAPRPARKLLAPEPHPTESAIEFGRAREQLAEPVVVEEVPPDVEQQFRRQGDEQLRRLLVRAALRGRHRSQARCPVADEAHLEGAADVHTVLEVAALNADGPTGEVEEQRRDRGAIGARLRARVVGVPEDSCGAVRRDATP